MAEELVAELLTRFKEVKLIDDADYASTVVRSRSEVSGRGKTRIRQELQLKGIDNSLIEEALAEVDPDLERETALRLAHSRMRSLRGLDRAVAWRRLTGFLLRRGYGNSLVSSVVEETLSSVEFSTGGQ